MVAITGVTAGSPATLQPAGTADVPQDIATLRGDATIGNTAFAGQTAWTTPGDYLELADGTHAYWDGTIWQSGDVPPPPLTGFTAGSPATLIPTGALPPSDLATLKTDGTLGDANYGQTTWTAGQYLVLQDGNECYWNGNAWLIGRFPPPVTGVIAGTPGAFTPGNGLVPADLATLKTDANVGDAVKSGAGDPAWIKGQYVVLDDNSEAYFDGTQWQVGKTPAPPLTGFVFTPDATTPDIEVTLAPLAADPPATLAALKTDANVGDAVKSGAGDSAWIRGQYITLADDSFAYWDGTVWQAGQTPAPPLTSITPGEPTTIAPPLALPPANLAALKADPVIGDTVKSVTPDPAWTKRQYLELGDGTQASWNGTEWVAGAVPTPFRDSFYEFMESYDLEEQRIDATKKPQQDINSIIHEIAEDLRKEFNEDEGQFMIVDKGYSYIAHWIAAIHDTEAETQSEDEDVDLYQLTLDIIECDEYFDYDANPYVP